jgi:hypothetical protein
MRQDLLHQRERFMVIAIGSPNLRSLNVKFQAKFVVFGPSVCRVEKFNSS